MRTTLDLPDDLMRKAKIAAATRGLKLKEFFTLLLEREVGSQSEPLGRIKRTLPEMIPATGVQLRNLTNAEIFEILDEEDDRTHGRLP